MLSCLTKAWLFKTHNSNFYTKNRLYILLKHGKNRELSKPDLTPKVSDHSCLLTYSRGTHVGPWYLVIKQHLAFLRADHRYPVLSVKALGLLNSYQLHPLCFSYLINGQIVILIAHNKVNFLFTYF